MDRKFKKLRVSLTNSCNLACSYCVDDKLKTKSDRQTLSIDELIQIIKNLHAILDLAEIRLTGGEPLLYQDLASLTQLLLDLKIPIHLTTNGYALESFLKKHSTFEISSMNISLDAVDEKIFTKISGGNYRLDKVLNGIDLAISKGTRVKLNSVIVAGQNASQILPLLEYAQAKNLIIRYLELMEMGHLKGKNKQGLFYQDEILRVIASKHHIKALPRNQNATANYWQTEENQIFGIIANESSPFCADCDRLRIDMKGNLYGCLSSKKSFDIRNKGLEELQEILDKAILLKQDKFVGSEIKMIDIGG